ncbi:MAG TPA: hypothetical protein VGK67_25785 [Myxococcales bacterium]
MSYGEAWFKGPVHYGKPVENSIQRDESEPIFALRAAGDSRPAMVGRDGQDLLDTGLRPGDG